MQLGAGGIVLGLIAYFVFGQDIFGVLSMGGGESPVSSTGKQATPSAPGADPEAELVQFVSFVLDDVQSTWDVLFRASGQRYQPAKLVVFRDSTPTACGQGQAATGPFYCPADQKAYIDLDFYDELHRRFGAPGDFAQAYVLAHEIGHHVQNLLGTSTEVHRAQQRDKARANELSVRLELQADCYAGVWAFATSQRDLLEVGDIEEGLAAAAAIGDDRLQKQATGRITPESWTHGSSSQRVRWFKRGYASGRMEDCDTFATDNL
jgi:predicted metalloprotease